MTKITHVRQNTNNSIFHFLNKKRPQNSHQCDNEYIFCISNIAKITYVRQNTNNSIYLLLNQK